MNPLKRRPRYTPPNPQLPEFTSEGGGELWKLVLDMHYKLGALETKTNIIGILVLGGLGAILARLLGAF
jgi:hypothetical protein